VPCEAFRAVDPPSAIKSSSATVAARGGETPHYIGSVVSSRWLCSSGNSDDCGDFAGCATIALRTGVGRFDGVSLSAILLPALTLSRPRKGAASKYTESGVNLFSSGYSITSLSVTLRRIRNGHPDSLGANRKLRGPVPDGEI
jgi:hypothetical protein